MSKNIHNIQSEVELETVIKHSTKPVVVDYWAPWCGPCKALNPILEEAAEALGDDAIIAKVNIDALPELARENGVSSIPTLFYFSNGRIRHRSTGITDTSSIITRVRSYALAGQPQHI